MSPAQGCDTHWEQQCPRWWAGSRILGKKTFPFWEGPALTSITSLRMSTMRNQCRSWGKPSSLALRSCRATFLLQDSCRLKYFTSLLWERREKPHGIPPTGSWGSALSLPHPKILPPKRPCRAPAAKSIQVWCPRGNFPPPQKNPLISSFIPKPALGSHTGGAEPLGTPGGGDGRGTGGTGTTLSTTLPHPSTVQTPTGHSAHFYSQPQGQGTPKGHSPLSYTQL